MDHPAFQRPSDVRAGNFSHAAVAANQRYLATTYNRASGIAVCQPAYILGEPSAFRYCGFRRHHPSNSPNDSAWFDSPVIARGLETEGNPIAVSICVVVSCDTDHDISIPDNI